MHKITHSILAATLAAAGLAAFTPAPALHAASLLAGHLEAARESDMRVRVTGVSTSDGQVLIAVYASEAAYDAGEPVARTAAPADRNGVAAVFEALPAGTYAVTVLHDANANDELDRNFVGMPTELYGFSGGAAPRFRAARFEEAAFEHAGEQTVTITLSGPGQ